VSGIRCMMMRGGTSKGLYFLASDLPAEPAERDALLLAIMGSGHPLQIDGLGGASPLLSKVAVVSRSTRDDADVDYLFLQLGVEQATITDQQNCGHSTRAVPPSAVSPAPQRRSRCGSPIPPGRPPAACCPPAASGTSSTASK
jgi:4-oxalomesaconate tautomerase